MAVLGAPAVRRLGGRTRTIMTVPEKQKRLERRRGSHGRWIRTSLSLDRPVVELVTTLGPRKIGVLQSSRTVSLRGAKWLW